MKLYIVVMNVIKQNAVSHLCSVSSLSILFASRNSIKKMNKVLKSMTQKMIVDPNVSNG